MNAQSSDERQQRLLDLSCLADGQADRDGVARVCSAWRQDAACRQAWHAWSVIGDAMRSQDLANPAQRDADFLAAVRARLAQEPVVLAPQPSSAADERRARHRVAWRIPVAMAAGCAMVAGALWVSRSAQEPVLDLQASAQASVQTSAGAEAMALAASDSALIMRSPELDRYLQAHWQYVQLPGLVTQGGVRQVATGR